MTGPASWRAVALAAACGLLSPSSASPFDCDQNGIDDFEEIQRGAVTDCDQNGIPDECDIAPVNHGLVAGQSLLLGSIAASVISQDLDGDGGVDVAVALPDEASVGIFWGAGSGMFTAVQREPVPTLRFSVAAGDLDADGLADIVSGGPDGMMINEQLTPKRFRTRSLSPMATGSVRGSLALADIDGDGKLDIVFAATFSILVFRNLGDWSFENPTAVPAGSGPVHLIATDIDADGDADIATANFLVDEPSGSVSIFLNRGDGTFLAGRSFAVGSAPASLTSGDIDRDGNLDLVTSNAGSSDISILAGRGDGTFAALPRIPVAGMLFSAALGDIDLDGDLDMAVARAEAAIENTGALSVYWNHGNGVLGRAFDLGTGGFPRNLVIHDVGRDPSPEILVSVGNQARVQVLEKALITLREDCDGSGVPDLCEIRERDCNANGLVDSCEVSQGLSKDCDGDHIPDECEADCNANKVPDDCDIALGTSPDCNGNSAPDECDIRSRSFGFRETALGLELVSLVAQDLDGDGHPDVAGVDSLNQVLVHWNEGGGAFAETKLAGSVGPHASLAAGDIDGDGALEILAASPGSRTLQLIAQRRPRVFSTGADVPLSESPVSLVAAVLDGDGLADAALTTESGAIILLAGRADGAMEGERPGPRGVAPHFLMAADVDGDGARDLAAVLSSGAPAIFWNGGEATFDERSELSTVFFIQTLAIEDLDGDGDLDVAGGDAGNLLYFFQVARRSFELRPRYVRGLDLRGLAAADFDRDGLGDIAIAQSGFFQGGIAFHLQRKNGAFEVVSPFNELYGFSAISMADFDGDGGMDIVASYSTCPPCGSSSQVYYLRNQVVPAASRDENANFRPDECDPDMFHRGDADGDGSLDLADAVFTLRWLFLDGAAPGCTEATDLDNNGTVNVADPVFTLEFLFQGGPPPAAPGPFPEPCGLDSDPPGSIADLGCDSYTSC